MYRIKTLLALALLLAGPAAAIDEAELLPPEEAFALQPAEVSADGVALTWKIADGYYLYESKFKAVPGHDGVLGDAELPPAKIKDDPFFGKIGTYRNSVTLRLPIKNTSTVDASVLDIATTVQGCADIGVCYPPQRQSAQVDMAALQSQATPANPTTPIAPLIEPAGEAVESVGQRALGRLSNLGKSLGFGGVEDELLPPDEAFRFIPGVADGNTLRLVWEVAPDYYMYRDKIKLSVAGPDTVALGSYTLPAGEPKDDPEFGKVDVYHGLINVDVPLLRSSTEALTLSLNAGYQGCADRGVCYPPITKTIELALPAVSAASLTATAAPSEPRSAAAAGEQASTAASAGATVSEQDKLAKFLIEKPLIISAGLFFLLGLGLAFTPCVFPMIPILSGIIAGQGDNLTTRKAFTLSLAYVLAMALTYTVVGIIAGLGGANLQIWFQNPWVLSIFAGIFVLLSLSMFGFYELQMPSAIQSKLNEISNKQEGGTLAGAGVMGFLSALIVGPCVTAPLIGALVVIGQTGDAVLGGTALFALSMGMGAPLLAIGTSAGKLLPRAGTWMEAIKAFFGVGLLAVAIWLLERILPTTTVMLLWGVLLATSGVYMGAFDTLREGFSGWHKFWKALGLVVFLFGSLQIIGAAAGSQNVWQPLRGLSLGGGGGGGQVAEAGVVFETVKGSAGLDQALALAAERGQPVMLDFYADWCIACKELEHYTFSDAGVTKALGGFMSLQTDVTANDAEDQALLKRFGLIGPPAVMFFAPGKEEDRGYRLVGYVAAEPFIDHVNRFKASMK